MKEVQVIVLSKAVSYGSLTDYTAFLKAAYGYLTHIAAIDGYKLSFVKPDIRCKNLILSREQKETFNGLIVKFCKGSVILSGNTPENLLDNKEIEYIELNDGVYGTQRYDCRGKHKYTSENEDHSDSRVLLKVIEEYFERLSSKTVYTGDTTPELNDTDNIGGINTEPEPFSITEAGDSEHVLSDRRNLSSKKLVVLVLPTPTPYPAYEIYNEFFSEIHNIVPKLDIQVSMIDSISVKEDNFTGIVVDRSLTGDRFMGYKDGYVTKIVRSVRSDPHLYINRDDVDSIDFLDYLVDKYTGPAQEELNDLQNINNEKEVQQMYQQPHHTGPNFGNYNGMPPYPPQTTQYTYHPYTPQDYFSTSPRQSDGSTDISIEIANVNNDLKNLNMQLGMYRNNASLAMHTEEAIRKLHLRLQMLVAHQRVEKAQEQKPYVPNPQVIHNEETVIKEVIAMYIAKDRFVKLFNDILYYSPDLDHGMCKHAIFKEFSGLAQAKSIRLMYHNIWNTDSETQLEKAIEMRRIVFEIIVNSKCYKDFAAIINAL